MRLKFVGFGKTPLNPRQAIVIAAVATVCTIAVATASIITTRQIDERIDSLVVAVQARDGQLAQQQAQIEKMAVALTQAQTQLQDHSDQFKVVAKALVARNEAQNQSGQLDGKSLDNAINSYIDGMGAQPLSNDPEKTANEMPAAAAKTAEQVGSEQKAKEGAANVSAKAE